MAESLGDDEAVLRETSELRDAKGEPPLPATRERQKRWWVRDEDAERLERWFAENASRPPADL